MAGLTGLGSLALAWSANQEAAEDTGVPDVWQDVIVDTEIDPVRANASKC